MRVLSVTWNGNQDITKVKFSDDFLSSNWTVKTDVLKDVIEELSYMYNGLLTLARNARTSVEMIDRFYAKHLLAEMNIEKLQSHRSLTKTERNEEIKSRVKSN